MFLSKKKGDLNVKKEMVIDFIFILIYKAVLDISYFILISQVWSHEGFKLNINDLKLAESYLLLLMVFILMPKTSKKLSSMFVYLMILLSYVPVLTIFSFMDQPRSFTYAITIFWTLVFVLLKIPGLHIPSIKNSQSRKICYFIFIFSSILIFLLIFKYVGFTINFDLAKVYEIRSYYIGLKIPFSDYLFDWSAQIINPIFFALFLIKRKWFFVIAITGIQILLFSSTGLKSFVFAIPFVLVLMWIVGRKNPFMWMTIGLSSIVLLGMASYYFANDIWVSTLFTRRTLFVPAQLSFYYYDYFSQNGPTFLSQHHLFQNFVSYPYALSPSYLIGEVYLNNPETNANNGIYADAFMNFGYVGFVLWAFLLSIILKLFDSFSKNKNIIITVAAIVAPALSLVNGALLTSLISHGITVSLIILYLLPKENQ